jgi:hypothetical protein
MRSDDQRRKLFEVLARAGVPKAEAAAWAAQGDMAAVARQDSRRGPGRQHQRRASRV